MPRDIQLIWLDLHYELYKFILSKVKDKFLSEEILQDAFIKIHTHLHQLKDTTRLTSWAYQITRNTISDYYNKGQLVQNQPLVDLAVDDGEEPMYRSLSECINSKINLLPAADKEAVLLTYFQDYSQQEISDFLGISYSGAKNRVQRAREKLRLYILNCENVESDVNGKITDFDIQ
jgi:RNA polymerase sigma-70 factor (ECF subfamily)